MTEESQANGPPAPSAALFDRRGRQITYLRVSVTDRCDLRCRYCIDGKIAFRPKHELLTLEEVDRVCTTFIRLGVRKLRVTGGEPLLRRGVIHLFRALGRHKATGAIDELTVTTNGGRLGEYAGELFECGVRRVNVSLDTLDPAKFRDLSGGGDVERIIMAVRAARAAGLRVKINAVALAHCNLDDLHDLVGWCGTEGFDLSLIELMPTARDQRFEFSKHHVAMGDVRALLEKRWTLTDIPHRSGGPAHYAFVRETGRNLGFIAPFAPTFCDECNRVRITASGRLVGCLGHAEDVDLKPALRLESNNSALDRAIRLAIDQKPMRNRFAGDFPQHMRTTGRTMNATGG